MKATVAERFNELELMVMPPNVSMIQRQEMRRMFYAGFFSGLMAPSEIAQAVGDDHALGQHLMQQLYDECRRFGQDVDAGRA